MKNILTNSAFDDIISLRTFVREVEIMSFPMLLRTVLEIALFAAVIWGFFHEDRLAAFERRVFCYLKRKKLKVIKPAVSHFETIK